MLFFSCSTELHKKSVYISFLKGDIYPFLKFLSVFGYLQKRKFYKADMKIVNTLVLLSDKSEFALSGAAISVAAFFIFKPRKPVL